MELSAPVSRVKGIGEKKVRLLARLNIYTVEDLLHHLPRDYEPAGLCVRICDVKEGDTFQVNAVIAAKPSFRRVRNGLNLTTISLSDETGRVEAVFFNQPYLKNIVKVGQAVCVSGASAVGRRFQFTNLHRKGGSPRQGAAHLSADGGHFAKSDAPSYAGGAGCAYQAYFGTVPPGFGRATA